MRVQGATQLTGAVNIENTLSASGQISTAGNLFAQGTTQLGGAVNLYSTLSSSGDLSTQGILRVQGATQLTGAVKLANGLSASQNITAGGIISGSTGRFTYLSGALSASSTGLPFLVAGSGVTTNFSHTDLNWTIAATGGGGTVQGSDTQVQFNQNGAFAASSSLTHFSGTLGVHAISGSLTSSGTVFGDIGYSGNILKINTNVLVTQSAMLFDGVGSAFDFGGLFLANGANLTMFSGSVGEDPPFSVEPSDTPDQVRLLNVGIADFVSGAVKLTNGCQFQVYSGSGGFSQFYVAPSFTSGKVDASLKGVMTITSGSLYVNSGSSSDSSFQIEPSATAAQVNVIFDRTGSTGDVNFQGINVRPLYSSMTTSGSAGTEMSGSLLLGSSGPNSVGKVDFNVVAVQKNTDNYGSWTFSTTVARDTAGGVHSVIAYSELDAATSGSDTATWDVNINSNAVIYCTGSAGAEIQWYAHVTKKMFLSGSGLITY